jgi:hypothetical protein
MAIDEQNVKEIGTMKSEYREGPEALERFGKTMTALFPAPKTVVTKKAEPVGKRTVAERAKG